LFLPLSELGQMLKQLRLRRHEAIVFHELHEDELTFPFTENTLFRGLEHPARMQPAQVQTEPRALKRSYLAAVERFLAEVRGACAAAGVDYLLMNTGQPLDAVLGGYLALRQKVRRTARNR
jgi:hypothetical protein